MNKTEHGKVNFSMDLTTTLSTKLIVFSEIIFFTLIQEVSAVLKLFLIRTVGEPSVSMYKYCIIKLAKIQGIFNR